MRPDLTPITIHTIPFQDQQPGTSGLRKKTAVFMQQNYLENFVQSTFDVLYMDFPDQFQDHTLVVGGDGRFFNSVAIQTIVKMAVANEFGRVMVAKDGILSTPAASAVIRENNALGGFILSASHNPGGADGDFGIKFNPSSGGPAPQEMTEKIFARTKDITTYLTVEFPDIDLSQMGTFKAKNTEVVVFDPLTTYTSLMEKIFDFDAIRALFSGVFRFNFDAMNAVTGPYAKHIFEDILKAPVGTVLHGTPLEDFGGLHPDPNLKYAAELVQRMYAPNAPDFGAASDGDGDRNLILGRGLFVTPGDSLAILVANATRYIPGYRNGLAGVARSMPTSMAVDLVAERLQIPHYETPTGWKFFVTLMDAGKCTICGEESFGTGSDHVREKDGIWAVLAWLTILAKSGKSVEDIVLQHWSQYGRNYFQRHDYEELNSAKAQKMISHLRGQLSGLKKQPFAGRSVIKADDFCYEDPVTNTVTKNQGIRIILDNGSRVICRLSGTGTSGATLRIYHDVYNKKYDANLEEVLKPYQTAMLQLLKLKEFCGVDKPTVIT
ncbi:MAG: alpha-D-glucose phosphate-specific phosphoglucomutase [Bdellovibrionota bacterium]|jgi:phosphoglucomutase